MFVVVEGQVHNSWNTWYCFSDVSEHYLKKASLVYLVPTELYKQLLLSLLFTSSCGYCCLQAAAVVVVVYKQLLFVVYLYIVLCHSLEAREHQATCNGWRSRRDTCIIQSNHSQYLFYWSSTTTESYILYCFQHLTLVGRPTSITRYFSPQSTKAIQSLSCSKINPHTSQVTWCILFIYVDVPSSVYVQRCDATLTKVWRFIVLQVLKS